MSVHLKANRVSVWRKRTTRITQGESPSMATRGTWDTNLTSK